MKTILSWCFLAALAVCVFSEVDDRKSVFSGKVRVARGFRMGAADRFSHGFGKRTESFPWAGEDSNNAISDEDLAEMVSSSPKLSLLFVRRFIDSNGDGVITRDELFDNRK